MQDSRQLPDEADAAEGRRDPIPLLEGGPEEVSGGDAAGRVRQPDGVDAVPPAEDCTDCAARFKWRHVDLCLGRGVDGRGNPPAHAVKAFREQHGIKCVIDNGQPARPCEAATPIVQSPEMPSLVVRGLNFAAALAGHALNGFQTRSNAEIEERLDICKACPFVIQIGEIINCSKCGCPCAGNNDIFLNKLAWKSQTCPEGKWT